MDVATDSRFLTPSEAAVSLGVSPTRVRQLIASGEIPHVVIGGRKRIPRELFEEWLDAKIEAARIVTNRGKETVEA
jgi:excisionase family DNA binding protein